MDPTDAEGRRELLTELLAAFGEASEIRPPLQCDYGYQTTDRGPHLHQLGRGADGCRHDHDR